MDRFDRFDRFDQLDQLDQLDQFDQYKIICAGFITVSVKQLLHYRAGGLLQYRAFLLHYRARNTYSIGRLLHYRLVQGAIQVLRNAIFLEIGPHPPPRNANNIEHITPS